MLENLNSEEDYNELFHRAEQNRSKGYFHKSMEIYLSLLHYRLAHSENLVKDLSNYDAIIIERLADLSWLMNLERASQDLLQSLQMVVNKAGNYYVFIYILLKRACIALNAGRWDYVKELLGELAVYIGHIEQIDFSQLNSWEGNCKFPVDNDLQQTILFSRLYFVFGVLLSSLGQYSDSVLALKRLLHHAEQYDHPILRQVIPEVNIEIARAYLEKGKLNISNEILQRIPVSDLNISSGNYVAWLQLRAKYCLMTGQLGEAKKLLNKIYTICKQYELHNGTVQALINLANLKIYLNQVASAESLLDVAFEFAKAASNHEAINRINNLKALALERGAAYGSRVSVMPTLTEIRSNIKRDPQNLSKRIYQIPEVSHMDSYLTYYEDNEMVFRLLLSIGDFDKADEYLRGKLRTFEFSDSDLIQVRMGILSFMMAYYRKKINLNFSHIGSILEFLHRQQLIPEQWQFQRIIEWAYAALQKKIDFRTSSSEELMDQMIQSLTSEDRPVFLLNKWSAEEENFAAKIDQLSVLNSNVRRSKFLHRWKWQFILYSKLNKFLSSIEKYRKEEVERYIGKRRYTDFITNRSSWIAKMLFSRRDCLWISFLVLPDRILVICWGSLILNFNIIPISRIRLREIVKDWHELTSAPYHSTKAKSMLSSPDETLNQGQQLSNKIAKELKLPQILNNLPKRVKRLRILPDDALNGLPFSALRVNNKYLIESYAISFSFRSRYQLPHKANNKDSNALIVGISEGSNQFPALPGIEEEIKILSSLFRKNKLGVHLLRNKTASIKNILEEVKAGPYLMHLASHGVFRYEQPSKTGLLLLNNEVLSLERILETEHFQKISFISLSSCWAADQFILPSRWIISLPETFCRAGIGSVLGNMWQVDDAVAVPFMERFYSYFFNDAKDVALQMVQIDALRNKLPIPDDTSHPFFWAGFSLYGDNN